MGVLPPVNPWLPEDDLLLKKSVEDGASLESLAKGAVQFSQRFTIREIQGRWYSLLYDPDISAEASERMIEVERSTAFLTSNKCSKVEASKEGRECQKRKVGNESVRRCYYAMRKRIHSDPLNQGDLNYIVPPVENCYADSNILEDPMGGHFEVGNTNFDDGAYHNFDLGDHGQLENHPNNQENECDKLPQFIHYNMILGQNSTAVGCLKSSKGMHGQNLFEDNMDMNPMPNIDNNNNTDIIYPGLEGNHIFNSPVSDCDASFHHLQCSSPPPAMPEWKNMGSTLVMGLAGDSHLRGENSQTGDPFGMPDELRRSSSKYDVHADADFQNHIACDEMDPATSRAQFDLAALSDTLLNLSDDEMLLMDDDGKEIDKYGLGNLLLDSPSDMNEDQMLNVPQVNTSCTPEAYQPICTIASTGQLDKGDQDLSPNGLVSALGEQKLLLASDINPQLNDICNGEQRLPSASDINPQLNDLCKGEQRPLSASDVNSQLNDLCKGEQISLSASDVKPQLNDLCNGVICCTLNTEDLEVPYNEHVIFPSKSRLTTLNRRGFDETIKDDLHNRELKRFRELHADSQARGFKMGLNHVGEHDRKLELPRTESVNTNPWHPGASSSNSMIRKTVSSKIVSLKQSRPDIPKIAVKSSDNIKKHFETGALGVKQEGHMRPAPKILEVNARPGTVDEMPPKGVEEPLLSVAEELPSEDDADIPCFSDIESMILDMDLGPEDLDLYTSRQVAVYQSENAKRAIIRLEQGAHAYMQRAIAFHGAFAVLYGHRSKHYIKKPEILLGRATVDVMVDIDLGKEGRANRISRRQAVIKMDENGVFHLRNLGKFPIFVDNQEVHQGQSSILHSKCLIEFREMHFIFEQHDGRVKQYLDAAQMKEAPAPEM